MARADESLRMEVLKQFDAATKTFAKRGVAVPKDVQLLRREIDAADPISAKEFSDVDVAPELPDGLFQRTTR